MSKKLLQDIVKIKNIKVKNSIQNSVEKVANKQKVNISILFFLFALSQLFLKATVTISPKMEDIVLNKNFSAFKEGSSDNFSFNSVILSGEETKIVIATEEKDFAISSKGKVFLYNNFSSSLQKLDIDTRLEGSNGKIYKTKKAVVIPGKNGDTPGKIEVEIYASKTGVEYDSAPLDFKIFGFKGTVKYSKFYGRSVGDITGGFNGKSPVVSDAVKENTIAELKESLRLKLLQKAIAPGFVLFKDAAFLVIDEQNIPFNAIGEVNVPITLKGTLYGFLFNEKKLTKEIVTNSIEKYDGSDVFISNINDLKFSLLNKENIPVKDLQNINFHLSGSAKIVWRLDESKLIADLLGKAKKDFNQVLLQYPNVVSAHLVVSPFWKMSIPNKIKDIKVIINYPK